MRRDYRVYLGDILEAIQYIQRYTRGYSLSRFAKDRKTVDAVIRNLEIIGEAVKNLPPALRKKHAGIEWKKMAGMRDILAHEYFGVDVEIVWDVVRHKLPPLARHVRRILRKSQTA